MPLETIVNSPVNTHKPSAAALAAAILLLAMSLRAPFTSLAPVLSWIQSDFLLTTASAGALTSLPILAFAVFSPFSASIAQRFGIERTLFGALVAILFGIAIRSAGSYWMLYAGTILIGVGGALGNVLLPSLIKRDFSGNVASMTGAYAITMGIAGAIGSILIIPLTEVWGWQVALLMLSLLPILALAVWVPHLNNHTDVPDYSNHQPSNVVIWRSPLAWQVTLFMGFNAMLFYIAVGWLPKILMDKGLSATEAGSMHGVLQLATAIPGLILAAVLRRMRDHRPAAVTVSLLSAVSLVGLICAPHFSLVWSAVLGFGCGASMMLGLTFVGLRTNTAAEAAALSGMSQSVGYLLGALGPLLLGALRDSFGSWSIPLLVATAIAILAAWMGMLAGRNVHLKPG